MVSHFPSDLFDYQIQAWKISIGMFAGYKAAIAWMEQGGSCESHLLAFFGFFPKTKAVFGVGVVYGMDMGKVSFCDVLVTSQITNIGDRLTIKDGKIFSHGQVLSTKETLTDISRDHRGWMFTCTTKGRLSNVVIGEISIGIFVLNNPGIKLSNMNEQRESIGG